MLTQEDLSAIHNLFVGQFDHIDKRLDGIDERLDGIDERLDGIDERLDGIDERLDGIDKRLDEHDRRFDRLDTTISLMQGDINALRNGQRDICHRLDSLSEKVDYTYHLAIDNWGNLVESKKRLDLLEG